MCANFLNEVKKKKSFYSILIISGTSGFAVGSSRYSEGAETGTCM